jgi:hypothetical protein
MILFYLTNTALDIASGVIWWVTKNAVISVYHGGRYMIYGTTPSSAYAALPDNTDFLQKQITILNDKIEQLSPN